MKFEQMLNRIDRPEFCRLREAKRLGSGVVNIGATGDGFVDRVGVDPSVVSRKEDHFRSVGKQFGGAAFVAFDVGVFVAKNGVVASAKRSERKRIRRSAIEDKIDLAGVVKYLTNLL